MFVGFCSQSPTILNLPQLEFFKTFIEKLGGTVPAGEPDFSFPGAKPFEKRLVFAKRAARYFFFVMSNIENEK